MSELEKLFSDVLNVTDKEANQFFNSISSHIGANDEDMQSIVSGEQKVSFPEQKTSTSGKVKIVHGKSESDYIWHISCDRPRCNQQVLIYTIIKTMNTVIPNTTHVDLYPPAADWDIKEWTFAARGILDSWNVQIEDLDGLSLKLLETINSVAN